MSMYVSQSLRLPRSGYSAEPQAKSGIPLHHTVCDNPLRLAFAAVQDSVTRLEAANGLACQTGCQAAYAGYQDLSRRIVPELLKPRITLGSALGLLGAVGIGVVVGRVPR